MFLVSALRFMPFFAAAVVSLGCTRGSPPTPPGIDPSSAPLASPSDAGGPSGHATDATQQSLSDGGAQSEASSKVLGQTRDRPPSESPEVRARAAALWDAIVNDDPARAMAFFFPLEAYEQVKAVGNPASDWNHRLVAAYKRDIHELSKRLGKTAERATFVGIEIPAERPRWIEPGEEWNKLGYWRVYGARIVYEQDQKRRTIELSSLISWRGQWFIVHLTGFR